MNEAWNLENNEVGWNNYFLSIFTENRTIG